MSEKKTIGVRYDADKKEKLERHIDGTLSDVVREQLNEVLASVVTGRAMLEREKERLENEIMQLESELEKKREELQDVEDRLDEIEDE